jgi:hypothetical protein
MNTRVAAWSLRDRREAVEKFDRISRISYNFSVKKSPRDGVGFETVRRIALSLPNVEEGTAWGLPAFRAGGKMFLCFREDLDSIVVRASFEQRDEMIEANPETYYTTNHHRGYPWVLARLAALHADVLPDLLRMALQSLPQKKRRPR